jgi:hypothetical protein
MKVARQAREFDSRMATAESVEERCYLAYLKGQMLATVALGVPQPASNFLPMFEEEFT